MSGLIRLSIAAGALLIVAVRAEAQTGADSAGVPPRRAGLRRGFYEGDTTKLIRSIRPEVAKYGFWIPRRWMIRMVLWQSPPPRAR